MSIQCLTTHIMKYKAHNKEKNTDKTEKLPLELLLHAQHNNNSHFLCYSLDVLLCIPQLMITEFAYLLQIQQMHNRKGR